MPRIVIGLIFCLTFAASALNAPAAAPAEKPTLLAQQSDSAFWVVTVVPPRGGRDAVPQALIRYRITRGGDWQQLEVIPNAHIVALASDYDDLIAVMDDGSWRRIGPGRFVAGQPLPGANSRVLAIASDAGELWAVGYGRPAARPIAPASAPTRPAATAPAPVTRAATLPASEGVSAATTKATTLPATSPAKYDGPIVLAAPSPASRQPSTAAVVSVGPLRLWNFVAGEWTAVADLPADVGDDLDRFSFTVSGRQPVLAYLTADNTIRTFRFNSPPAALISSTTSHPSTNETATTVAFAISRHWLAQDWGDIHPQFVVAQIKLVATPLGAALWAAPALDDSPGRANPATTRAARTLPTTTTASAATRPNDAGFGGVLYFRGETWTGPHPLSVHKPDFFPVRRTVAAAGEDVRLVMMSEDEKIWEASYEPTNGDAFKPLEALPEIRAGRSAAVNFVLQLVVPGLVMLAMFATLTRRRSATDDAHLLDEWALAPFGYRFMAGLIDLLPIWIALWVYTQTLNTASPDSLASLPAFARLFWISLSLVGVYLLHTTLSELFTGRTFGKALFGLRVVGINGQPAKAWPILFRNLLRLMEVSFVGLPWALILFSRLRQRIGDAAAGTVVVMPKSDTERPDARRTKDEDDSYEDD